MHQKKIDIEIILHNIVCQTLDKRVLSSNFSETLKNDICNKQQIEPV